MKKLLAAIGCLLLGTFMLQAQPDMPPDNDKIKALRVAFLTQELDLSPEQAQVFWPVYNEFHKELRGLKEERKNILMGIDEQELSEGELEKRIQRGFDLEEEIVALRIEYHEKFKSILSLQKIADLYAAELHFQRRVLEELHKRKMRHHRNSGE